MAERMRDAWRMATPDDPDTPTRAFWRRVSLCTECPYAIAPLIRAHMARAAELTFASEAGTTWRKNDGAEALCKVLEATPHGMYDA